MHKKNIMTFVLCSGHTIEYTIQNKICLHMNNVNTCRSKADFCFCFVCFCDMKSKRRFEI